MSSTTDPLPPLGTAAHLPPGGLIVIAWSGVVLAGAFGECIFGASARRSGAYLPLRDVFGSERRLISAHSSCLVLVALSLESRY